MKHSPLAVLAALVALTVLVEDAEARKPRKRKRAHAAARAPANMPEGWTWPPSKAMRAAGKACTAELDQLGVRWKKASAQPKIATPITVPAMVFGGVKLVPTFRPPPFVMDCALARTLALHGQELYARGVRELHFSRIYGNTPVRTRGRTLRALRHALGLAVDVRAIVDDTGRKAIVLDDYLQDDPLLLAVEAYLNDSGGFRTVLTPRNDPASHDDHFHVEARADFPSAAPAAAAAVMRAVAALALVTAACASELPDVTVDGGGDGDGAPAGADGGSPDADPCRAPTIAPVWLDSYLTTTVAQLTGAAEIAPGVRLADRATATRRTATRTFLTAELASLGLTATLDDYGSGANVMAELPATSGASAALVIVGAHFDTVPGSPGADDNAAGVAAALAVARMLRDVACRDRRVQFVLFDQEEIGLVGSTYLAGRLRQANATVTAAHTIDQIGWDGDGDRRFEIEQPTPTLLAAYQAAAATLGVGVDETATGSTDHQAFRERGFAAVGITEEFVAGDTTPHYHAATDTAATLVLPYLALGTRLVALVVARQLGAP